MPVCCCWRAFVASIGSAWIGFASLGMLGPPPDQLETQSLLGVFRHGYSAQALGTAFRRRGLGVVSIIAKARNLPWVRTVRQARARPSELQTKGISSAPGASSGPGLDPGRGQARLHHGPFRPPDRREKPRPRRKSSARSRDQGRLSRPSPGRQHATALHRFPGEGTSPAIAQRRRVPAMMGLNLLVLYQAESATKPTTKRYVRTEQC